MNETPTTAPILTVTWDTVIGSRCTDPGGYDEPPAYEPVSLGEAVVSEIASQLIEEVRRDIRSEVLQAVKPTIQAEIVEIVREALKSDIRRINQWGEAQGELTTLRDLLADDVKAYLAEPARRDRYDERKGGFRELLRAEVDEAMRKELREEITAARATVAQQVKERAGQLFGEAVNGLKR